MIAIQKMITTKNCYIGKNKPKYIVIHETDNWDKGAGAKRHAQAINNGNLKGTVHYYVDDKNIYQTLDHKNGAYAIGDNNNKINNSLHGIHNWNSINIEICVNLNSDYTLAVKNAIDLTKSLMESEKIDIKNVVRHYDATRKNCPRKIISTKGAWEDFKNKTIDNSKQVLSSVSFENGSYNRKVKVVTNGSNLNVRDGRGFTRTNVIGKFKDGQIIEVNYCIDNWFSTWSLGKEGYISGDFIELI